VCLIVLLFNYLLNILVKYLYMTGSISSGIPCSLDRIDGILQQNDDDDDDEYRI
jgi:hypothetical protein